MMRIALCAGASLWLWSAAATAACPESKDSAVFFAEAQRLLTAGQSAAAIECQQRGVELAGDTLKATQERQVLAGILEKAGKVPESVELLKVTLPQMERLTGPQTEATADVLRQLGWAEYLAGAPVDAETHLRRSHAIYLALLGPRHLKVAKALNRLGVVLRDQVQYEESEIVLAMALDVASKGLTPDDDMRAVIYNNMGGLWYYRGDYRRAIEHFKAALPIFERLQGEISSDVGRVVNNIGAVSEEIGDYETARIYYTRALAIQEKLLGPMHPTVGGPVGNLAVLAHSTGDTARADVLFRRAMNIYESGLGPNHPTLGEVLLKYGALKRELGQYAQALELLERALRIQEGAFGPDNNWAAQSLNEMGAVYQATGQSARAKEALVRSIGIVTAGDEPQVLLIAYGRYADVLAANSELAGAAFYGKFAVNLAQRIRNDMSELGRTVQISYLAKHQQLYRNLADRLIALGRLAEAEQVMTMLKEEEYFDFVRIAVRAADGGSTRADFSAAERPYADQLERTATRLAESASAFRTAEDEASVKEARAAALSLEQREMRSMLVSVSRTLAAPAPMQPTTSRAAPPVEALRKDIAPGSALVRYLVTERRVRMIVATQAETIDTQVSVDLPRLNRLVFDLRQAVQNPKSDPLPAAQTLHKILIAPLQAVLTRNQIVSLQFELDGALRYVPFAALHDGKSFLVERFDVQQRTLANLEPRAPTANTVQQLAGFGVSKAVGGFPALPSVGAELDRIVLRGPDDRDGVVPGVVLLDAAFTESSLRSVLARDFSLIHLASHFVFRPGPLSDSYLLLGDGESLTLERLRDGKVSLANVRLLTLAACSTAMGESSGSGGELESFGVLAQRLGAREVLASLWPVSDRSTSMLMLSLYRGVDNGKIPTAQALRRAQLSLLRGDRRFAPYAHPFYWAPFVLMSAAGR